MSYEIGQLKRSDYSNYTSDISFTKESFTNQTEIIDFEDPCLSITNFVTSNYNYYIKFNIKQLESSTQNITIKLHNDDEEDNEQEIRSITVLPGLDYTSFEMIFMPNNSYNKMIFQLRRTVDDYTVQSRIVDLTVEQFSIVNNVITYLTSIYSGLTTLKQIGLQGPPGLLFALDGEEVRIGRSGIYELYHDEIEISYLGFIIKDSSFTQDGKDYFILDFKY